MLDPVRRVAANLTPGSRQSDIALAHEAKLYRFGLAWEPVAKLAADAAAALSAGYPHGISTFAISTRADAVSANRTEVEQYFSVMETGRNPLHQTVVLPRPITDDVAVLVNQLFGRTRT